MLVSFVLFCGDSFSLSLSSGLLQELYLTNSSSSSDFGDGMYVSGVLDPATSHFSCSFFFF